MHLICLAPLPIEVSKAGGIGFIGGGSDLAGLDENLAHAADLVCRDQKLERIYKDTGVLPVGSGVLSWVADLELAVAAVEKWSPAALWLFAPRKLQDLVVWTTKLRSTGKRTTKIWIQVGTVSDASEIARTCHPDVLLVQGADAGGHGLDKGARILTLLPEIADSLREQGFDDIPLIAAGGIGEGRGVAAALILGACGAVLGTRLLATPEAEISRGYLNVILEAGDGGISTIRTKIYDQLRGTTEWPRRYGGRGVINQSFLDHTAGLPLGENKRRHDEFLKRGAQGWGVEGRLTTYAGTVVVLVRSVKGAGEAVQEVRRDASGNIEKASITWVNRGSALVSV